MSELDRRLGPAELASWRADALASLDLREHNADATARPRFSPLRSQACTAEQFSDPAFTRWLPLLLSPPAEEPSEADGPELLYRRVGPEFPHRKIWEWAFVLQATEQHGLLAPQRRAIGFGVGREPIPAVLAAHGVDVVATDQAADDPTAPEWAATDQLLRGVEVLRRPDVIADDDLSRRLVVRAVDMNDLPNDLGTFDLLWSSCAMEHLGSPELGAEFVLSSARLLRPGGIAVHTTELELTRRTTTADYGNMAVYRVADLRELGDRLTEAGYEVSLDFSVPLDTPADRFISLVVNRGWEVAAQETGHLKLAIGESVSTSFGLIVRRPEQP